MANEILKNRNISPATQHTIIPNTIFLKEIYRKTRLEIWLKKFYLQDWFTLREKLPQGT